MSKVDLSMKKLEKFADDVVKYTKNLNQTAKVFDEIVTPVAKESGSELLLGVSQDVQEIQEEFGAKATTAQRIGDGVKEYTKQLERINSL